MSSADLHQSTLKEAKNVAIVNTNKATFKKLVCPFDLDAVFSMQYSVSGLKSVLEFIIENLDSTSIQISEIAETVET